MIRSFAALLLVPLTVAALHADPDPGFAVMGSGADPDAGPAPVYEPPWLDSMSSNGRTVTAKSISDDGSTVTVISGEDVENRAVGTGRVLAAVHPNTWAGSRAVDLAVARSQTTSRVYRVSTGKTLLDLDVVTRLDLSADGRCAFASPVPASLKAPTTATPLKVWDVDSQKLLWERPVDASFDPLEWDDIACSADRTLLAQARRKYDTPAYPGRFGRVSVWNGTREYNLEGASTGAFWQVRFVGDTHTVVGVTATRESTGEVRFWDGATGACTFHASFTVKGSGVDPLLSGDGHAFVTHLTDTRLAVYEVRPAYPPVRVVAVLHGAGMEPAISHHGTAVLAHIPPDRKAFRVWRVP